LNVLADEDRARNALNFGPEAVGHALESATASLHAPVRGPGHLNQYRTPWWYEHVPRECLE
jgi:hypothetical protein